MSANENCKKRNPTAWKSLPRLGLLAGAVLFSHNLYAQTLPATPSKPAARPASGAPARSAGQPSLKGAQEGIKVHGHWIIEVRNPDGKLEKHAEFENGLCLAAGPNINNTFLNGGDTLLAGLLSATLAPANWQIVLGSPAVPSSQTPSPACGFTPTFYLIGASSGLCSFYGASCFATLSAPTLNAPGGNVVTLTGQFTVPSGSASTQITAVGTSMSPCSPPAQCLANTGGTSSLGMLNFTGAYLTGVAPMPPPITVSANQQVSVTVQISFQ